MIQWLFGLREGNGGEDTGTLIWTSLVMNFWLSWRKTNKFLSFIRRSHLICLLPLGEEWMDQRFYMMFPAFGTMLSWLQRNPCNGVRCELLEQCLGLSLVSLPSEGGHAITGCCTRTAPGRSPVCLSLWQVAQCQPPPLLAFIFCEKRSASYQWGAFGRISCARKVSFLNARLSIELREPKHHLESASQMSACVGSKWKAPHLCLHGTQICLTKESIGNPGHCLSPWNKHAPIHHHHHPLTAVHWLDFFPLVPHQKGCLHCLSQYLCLLFTYWLPSCPLCRIFWYFNGSLEKMVSVLLCFSEHQFPAQGEPCHGLHPFTRLAYGFASSSGRMICSSSRASGAGEFGHLPLLLLTLSGSTEKYFRKSQSIALAAPVLF